MEVSVLMMKRASESERPEAWNFWRASSRESARTERFFASLRMTAGERALEDRPKGRPLQYRSTGSGRGSRENSTQVRERSTCTKLEQMRRRERVRNSAESSQPRAWRRRRKAARSVVPEPEKGSRTRSPSLEQARRMRSRRATGFWVGCLPNFFSQDSGGRISQTDFICLPRLASFMSL